MKRAFLDLDGTLLNSKERHCNVLRDVLIQYGFGNRQVLDFVEYKANGKNTRQYLEDVHGFSKDIADKIRIAFDECGIVLKDTKEGTTVEAK